MGLPSTAWDSLSLKCTKAFNQVNIKGQPLQGTGRPSQDPGSPTLPGLARGLQASLWQRPFLQKLPLEMQTFCSPVL